jgi:hypothetical protein
LKERVVIEEGVAMLEQVAVVRTVDLNSFKEILGKDTPITTPVLPRGCIAYMRGGDYQLYCIEMPPATRGITFKNGNASSTSPSQRYRIPMPWTYMIVEFRGFAISNMWIYFSNTQIEKVEQDLYLAPFTNVSPDGKVCIGNLRFSSDMAINKKVEGLTTDFWNTQFNLDIADIHLRHMPTEIRGSRSRHAQGWWYHAWAEKTQAEICSMTWSRYSSLQSVMNDIRSRWGANGRRR